MSLPAPPHTLSDPMAPGPHPQGLLSSPAASFSDISPTNAVNTARESASVATLFNEEMDDIRIGLWIRRYGGRPPKTFSNDALTIAIAARIQNRTITRNKYSCNYSDLSDYQRGRSTLAIDHNAPVKSLLRARCKTFYRSRNAQYIEARQCFPDDHSSHVLPWAHESLAIHGTQTTNSSRKPPNAFSPPSTGEVKRLKSSLIFPYRDHQPSFLSIISIHSSIVLVPPPGLKPLPTTKICAMTALTIALQIPSQSVLKTAVLGNGTGPVALKFPMPKNIATSS